MVMSYSFARPEAKILIVDDAVSMRAVLRAFFNTQGHVVVGELGHGVLVLNAIARLHPDIVCLDYNLPDVNGIALLKEIHDRHPAVAVVMITGEIDPDLEGRAAEAGAAGFLRKPFQHRQMLDLIARL